MTYYPARLTIDLAAIRENIATLRSRTAAAVMPIIKADAYGHGLIPVARSAVAAGADWLGTAHITEALQLRRAGLTVRILSWLYGPSAPLSECVAADIDLSVPAPWALEKVVAAAREIGRPARVHLKVDTGMGRNGVTMAQYPDLLAKALRAQEAGDVFLVGIWSHLACADSPQEPINAHQVETFRMAVAQAENGGAQLEVRHLANSAATLLNPQAHFNLVRPGLAVYGLTPAPAQGSAKAFGLRPAMTLSADLALVKDVAAGQSVSYDQTYTTAHATKLGVVPLGYGDGIPRHGSNRAEIFVPDGKGSGVRAPVAGRICMDQFVTDLGAQSTAAAGDEALLFGPGSRGEPTAEDWAQAAQTISYEIVTRMGSRLPRVFKGEMPPAGSSQ